MLSVPVSTSVSTVRVRTRTALIASADNSFRQRLSQILTGLRWQVREAEGGAQVWAEAQSSAPEAVIVDSWLPDLDLAEFLNDFKGSFPARRPHSFRRRLPRSKAPRSLSSGTALRPAPLSGYGYGFVETAPTLNNVGEDHEDRNHAAPWPILCAPIPSRRIPSHAPSP